MPQLFPSEPLEAAVPYVLQIFQLGEPVCHNFVPWKVDSDGVWGVGYFIGECPGDEHLRKGREQRLQSEALQRLQPHPELGGDDPDICSPALITHWLWVTPGKAGAAKQFLKGLRIKDC